VGVGGVVPAGVELELLRLRVWYSELSRYPSPSLSPFMKSRLSDSSAAASERESLPSPFESIVLKLPPIDFAAEFAGNPPRLGDPCPGAEV
jgi:hypothetical protein